MWSLFFLYCYIIDVQAKYGLDSCRVKSSSSSAESKNNFFYCNQSHFALNIHFTIIWMNFSIIELLCMRCCRSVWRSQLIHHHHSHWLTFPWQTAWEIFLFLFCPETEWTLRRVTTEIIFFWINLKMQRYCL